MHQNNGFRALAALVSANARYWPTVLPRVQQHLRAWERRAAEIPDPTLRELATHKLRDERFNSEVAATLAVLARRRHRPSVLAATVSLQVMYDYLDGVTEYPSDYPLRSSRCLFRAFVTALQPDPLPHHDYYRWWRGGADGGYLDALSTTCREAFWELPSAAAVLPAASRAAMRCGEAQSRVHAACRLGTDQLATWASAQACGSELTWWEYAAGGAASVLSIHALLSAAADPRTTPSDAEGIDAAYLAACALSTLLDSLIDHEADVHAHRFVDYYPSPESAAERLTAIATYAATSMSALRFADHHAMAVAGVAAYYLSAPQASEPAARKVAEQVIAELRPTIVPALAIFRLWRLLKSRRAPQLSAPAQRPEAPTWRPPPSTAWRSGSPAPASSRARRGSDAEPRW